MIEIKGVNKSFNDKHVIKNISANFEPGKTNMIIGASGTGKSVLLKMIVGLIKPDSGEILFDGRDFHNSNNDSKTAIRREIGMLFQGSALFDSKTVYDNIKFPLDMLTRKKEAEKQERVNFCLKRVGLENTNDLMPSEISGGMKKRVGIARAIVMNPKYLFVDEPNSGLDPQTSIKIDELIHEITEEYGITSVIVSHDMNSVMEIGENIIFLFKGEKIWEGNHNTILDSDHKELVDFIYANKLMKAREKLD